MGRLTDGLGPARLPPDAHQHVAIWTQAAPQLDGFDSPAEILDAVGCLGAAEQSCRLLSGLLLAAHYDGLAAYAVLVAIIPGLRVAAGRRWQTARSGGPWSSRDELDTDTISAAWLAIAAHAGRTPSASRPPDHQSRGATSAHQPRCLSPP